MKKTGKSSSGLNI